MSKGKNGRFDLPPVYEDKSKSSNMELFKNKKNVLKKIQEVRADLPALYKDKPEKLNYTISKTSDIIEMFKNILGKHGLLILPKIKEVQITEKQEKYNLYNKTTRKYESSERPVFRISAKVIYTMIDIASGEFIEVPWYTMVTSTGDHGMLKAMSYSEKNFLLKTFNVPTIEPDNEAFISLAEKNKIFQAGKQAGLTEEEINKGALYYFDRAIEALSPRGAEVYYKIIKAQQKKEHEKIRVPKNIETPTKDMVKKGKTDDKV